MRSTGGRRSRESITNRTSPWEAEVIGHLHEHGPQGLSERLLRRMSENRFGQLDWAHLGLIAAAAPLLEPKGVANIVDHMPVTACELPIESTPMAQTHTAFATSLRSEPSEGRTRLVSDLIHSTTKQLLESLPYSLLPPESQVILRSVMNRRARHSLFRETMIAVEHPATTDETRLIALKRFNERADFAHLVEAVLSAPGTRSSHVITQISKHNYGSDERRPILDGNRDPNATVRDLMPNQVEDIVLLAQHPGLTEPYLQRVLEEQPSPFIQAALMSNPSYPIESLSKHYAANPEVHSYSVLHAMFSRLSQETDVRSYPIGESIATDLLSDQHRGRLTPSDVFLLARAFPELLDGLSMSSPAFLALKDTERRMSDGLKNRFLSGMPRRWSDLPCSLDARVAALTYVNALEGVKVGGMPAHIIRTQRELIHFGRRMDNCLTFDHGSFAQHEKTYVAFEDPRRNDVYLASFERDQAARGIAFADVLCAKNQSDFPPGFLDELDNALCTTCSEIDTSRLNDLLVGELSLADTLALGGH